jgi:hypothetical protein
MPSLAVTEIVRVTNAPGMRDNAVAAAGPRGLVVFWDESPGIDRSGNTRPPVRIWRARVDGESAGRPERLTTSDGNQWWPTVLTDDRGGWLAYYAADSRHRTGDRDIVLQALDANLGKTGKPLRVSVDPAVAPLPLNDATPALLRTNEGDIVLVWSRGEYDARAKKYADKNLILRVRHAGGSLGPESTLTGKDEIGREMAPALGTLPGGRIVLAYVSDSAHEGRPVIYARALDSRHQAGPPRRLTDPARGVTRPSFARTGSTLWLSWYDLQANDIRIARVLTDSTLSTEISLRDLLVQDGFGKYGVAKAALSGASLFVDQNKLGIAFIATMAFDRAARRAQQDVFLAWLSVR